MSIRRVKDRSSVYSTAPPPSPIPTGKGSRSAADSFFSEYVDKSSNVPDLTLPKHVNLSVPTPIDYQAIISKNTGAINRILRLAGEFGVFRISDHGISVELLRSIAEEDELVFGLLKQHCHLFPDREEFVWCRSDKATVKRAAADVIGAETYRSFSQKVDILASKLEAIAQEVGQIFTAKITSSKQSRREIQSNEPKLSLYRHINHGTSRTQNQHLSKEMIKDSFEYALCLHLPLVKGEFFMLSEQGPVFFNASPDSIIVTIGEKAQDYWSNGELKSAYGELKSEQNLPQSPACFSFALKWSPLNRPSNDLVINTKTISVANQLLIILIIYLLFKIIGGLYF